MPEFQSGSGRRIPEQVNRTQRSHLDPEFLDFPQQQYLSFRLNERWYALSVYHLVEVLPPPKISRVPNMPDHILGVMNFRGEVLSAIDLKRFFGLPQVELPSDAAIIVVAQEKVRTGILVDNIGDLVSLSQDNVTKEPVAAGEPHSIFIEGTAHWGDLLLNIIALEELMQFTGMAGRGSE